jgi:hypothetical protein
MLASVQEQSQAKIKELEAKLAQSASAVAAAASVAAIKDAVNAVAGPPGGPAMNAAAVGVAAADANVAAAPAVVAGADDKTNCVVCLERARNIAFAPCGHVVCCATCTAELKQCPICRQQITSSSKIFLS